MFRKIWFGLILMAILLSVSAVLSTETGVNFDETLVTAQQEVPVEISVDIYGVCRNETVIIGKRGWSDETFVLTLLSPMVVDVHLYDSFLVGDYYELWDNSTGTPVLVGATPVVPGYWEGGTEYSEGWFTLSLSAGVHKFRVRDYLFDRTGIPPGMSPAGFYIGFHMHPIGGEIIPANHLTLLAPWITLALLVSLVATAPLIYRRIH